MVAAKSGGKTNRKRLAFSNIEAVVGGRAALVETLAAADLSEKHSNLLTKLADPRRSGDSLQAICAEDGIMLSEILLLLKDAAVAQGMVAAMRIGGESLPAVMEDIVRKSVDRVLICKPCHGTGKLGDGKDCLDCFGAGKVKIESSLERQKLLGDWMQLGPKKGGVNVNVGVNQQVGVSLPGGLFSRLVKDTDAPAYDVSPAKEILDGDQCTPEKSTAAGGPQTVEAERS